MFGPPPGHPPNWARASQALNRFHSPAYMFAFHLFVDVMIVDPAITMADDLVAAFDKGVGDPDYAQVLWPRRGY